MIPIFKPSVSDKSKLYVSQAMEANDIAQGPFINRFETTFSSFCGRKYGVTCSNGTVALYMAIKALELPKGSEVILPSMTIVSCLTAIIENGLKPVFCDIDKSTYNIDFKSAQSKITNNTSALIVVNTYGLMVDVLKLKSFKQQNPSIKIIEDASESHGATYKDTPAGSLGDISTFSFYTNKVVSMGEGGIVLTDDEHIKNTLFNIKNLGFTDRKKYINSHAGFNFRLSNLHCAVGLGELESIKNTIYHRKRVAHRYNDNFINIPEIQIPQEPTNYSNVYWYYALKIKHNQKKVLKTLNENQIDYRHFFYPLHKQPFIESKEILINSENCFDLGVLLPTYNDLSENEIDEISNIIKTTI